MRFKKNTCCFITLLFLLSFFLVSVPARVWNNKPSTPNEKRKPCKEDKKNPPSPLTVLLNVLVTDVHGRTVADVGKDGFIIIENGVPQQLSMLVRREGPLRYGLVIDHSGSMRTQLRDVVLAANALIETNAHDDELFLVSFISTDKIELRQNWTSDRDLLRKRLAELYVAGGRSAIVDAVYESAQHLSQHLSLSNTPRRSALVVFTDGEDRESFYKREQLMKLLGELKIPVFVIGFTRELESGKAREKATDFLLSLTQDTGGRAFFPKTKTELTQAITTIRQELTAQYRIGYQPVNQSRDNAVRPISVEIATRGGEKRLALARPNYVALCR